MWGVEGWGDYSGAARTRGSSPFPNLRGNPLCPGVGLLTQTEWGAGSAAGGSRRGRGPRAAGSLRPDVRKGGRRGGAGEAGEEDGRRPGQGGRPGTGSRGRRGGSPGQPRPAAAPPPPPGPGASGEPGRSLANFSGRKRRRNGPGPSCGWEDAEVGGGGLPGPEDGAGPSPGVSPKSAPLSPGPPSPAPQQLPEPALRSAGRRAALLLVSNQNFPGGVRGGARVGVRVARSCSSSSPSRSSRVRAAGGAAS